MSGTPWGGSEELWAAMAVTARERGFDVSVSLYRWPSTPERIRALMRAGVHVLYRPLRPRATRLDRIRKKIFGESGSPFADVLQFNPDVICVSQGFTYDAAYSPELLKMLLASHIPYVVVCHSNSDAQIPSAERRERIKELFARAHRVVFVSSETVRLTERHLAQRLENSIVLRNPVKMSDLSVVPWPPLSVPALASVGHLWVAWKGQDILLEVLGAPAWRGRDWQLRFCGDGPDKAYLQHLAGFYGLSERIAHMGFVEDVRSIWAENHILVFPSRVESAPLVLVEAMLCGRPSVVTDVGGITEWVEDVQEGFLAAAPTRKSFGEALERAWQAMNCWQQMGGRAHERAMAQIDPEPGRTLLNVILSAV